MYKKHLTDEGYTIVRDIDGAHIPEDKGNRDYQEFLEFLTDSGLTINDIEAANPEFLANEYLRKREDEYPSKNDMITALWEQVIEGKVDAATELQKKIVSVKLKYPKEEKVKEVK